MSSISTDAAIESVLAAKQAATHSNLATTIAAKTLDSQRAAGDAALQLLSAASGQGRADGKGGHFDAVG